MKIGGTDINLVIPAYGSLDSEPGQYDYLRLISCDTAACPIIQIDGEDKFQSYVGWFRRFPLGQYFIKAKFFNPTAAPMTVVAVACLGEIGSSVIAVGGEMPVRMITNAIETLAAVSVGTSVAVAITPPAGVRELHLQINGNYPAWYGDAAVNATTKRGIKMPVSGTFILTSGATVYWIADGGATVISVVALKLI